MTQKDAVRAAQVEQLARLRDVLCGRPPVDVAACVSFADAVEFPDHRNQRMAGSRQALADVVHVEVFVACLAFDFLGGVLRDDSKFRLRLREGDFDIEPCLNARGFAEDVSDAGVRERRWVRFALMSSVMVVSYRCLAGRQEIADMLPQCGCRQRSRE